MASRKIESDGFFHHLASIGAPVYQTLSGEKRVCLPSGRRAARRVFNAYYASIYEADLSDWYDLHRQRGVRKHPIQWQWD